MAGTHKVLPLTHQMDLTQVSFHLSNYQSEKSESGASENPQLNVTSVPAGVSILRACKLLPRGPWGMSGVGEGEDPWGWRIF